MIFFLSFKSNHVSSKLNASFQIFYLKLYFIYIYFIIDHTVYILGISSTEIQFMF